MSDPTALQRSVPENRFSITLLQGNLSIPTKVKTGPAFDSESTSYLLQDNPSREKSIYTVNFFLLFIREKSKDIKLPCMAKVGQ